MDHQIVLTGGPGGGKTTLLDALAELSPPPDPVSLVQEILSSNIEKYRSAIACAHAKFFDRGELDALYMLDAESELSRTDIAS